MNNRKDYIIKQIPDPYRGLLNQVSFHYLEEIRFRINRPIILQYHNTIKYLGKTGAINQPDNAVSTNQTDLKNITSHLLNQSVYAHIDDLKEGFITLGGGHRVGFAGKSIIKNGQVTGMTSISGINIRVANEYLGCADQLVDIIKYGKEIKNTLLISPPQTGKTTFLRDLCRTFSNEYKITIIDERSEIAGCADGSPQFSIGMNTDVLDRFPKSKGMLLALRSLSPHILITDELGDKHDMDAIREVSRSGCKIFASIHGESIDEVMHKHNKLLSYFDLAVLLGRINSTPAILSIKKLR